MINLSKIAVKIATGMLKAGVVGAASIAVGGGFDKVIGLIGSGKADVPEITTDTVPDTDITGGMTEAIENPTEVEVTPEVSTEVEA